LIVQMPGQRKRPVETSMPPIFRLSRGSSHLPGCANDVAGGVPGWRTAAEFLGLPAWQLRRLAVLVAGRANDVGLLELVVIHGRSVLNEPEIARAIESTLHRWAPCPSGLIAARYERDRSLQAA